MMSEVCHGQTRENQARTAALQQEAARWRQAVAYENQRQLSTEYHATKAELQSAKNAYAEALDRGEFQEGAEQQERLATAAARLAQLEQIQNYQQQMPQQPQYQDPVEAAAAGRSERSASWLRQHRDWVTDPQKNSFLTEAHFNAVRNGKAVDSPEYYEHVEKYIGLKKGKSSSTARRRSGGDDPNTVRLSSGEAAAATNGAVVWNKIDVRKGLCRPDQVGSPVGYEEYARRKRALAAQGFYDRLGD